MPAPAPPAKPPIAPALSASLRLPPANKVEPALPTNPDTAATPTVELTPIAVAAAGPSTKARAKVVTMRPTLDLANFLTALPMLLSALPTPLKSFLRGLIKNSGSPVFGLMLPLPPICFKTLASRGEMCANMVSPYLP